MTFEEKHYEQSKQSQFFPRVVVETDYKRKVYNGEVLWYGANYVIAPGCKTREEAEQRVGVVVEKLVRAMEAVAGSVLGSYRKAKE